MLRRFFNRTEHDLGSRDQVALDKQILRILDDAAANFTFLALDNGYIYPAAARLSAHRSDDDWAIVIEEFGFSPRAMDPYVSVLTFASRVRAQKTAGDFVSALAFDRYERTHPNDFAAAYFPLDGAWKDENDLEMVRADAKDVLVRGRARPLPPIDEYLRVGIKLESSSRVHIFELCRYLASVARDEVLATREERQAHVPLGTTELLVLDEWNHPDVVGNERPSDSETFRQLAKVLATGDVSEYRPSLAPNTHWSNWPDGGTL